MHIIIIISFLIILFLIIQIICYQSSYDNYKIVINNGHKTNKLMIIAHPDDESLWGYRYLKNDPSNWKVICLTEATNKIRSNEFINAMKFLKICNFEIWSHDNSIFAHYIDDKIVNDLEKEMVDNGCDLILTHNQFGEYGNLQHISIHNTIKKIGEKHNMNVKYFKIKNYHYPMKKRKLLDIYKSQYYIIKSLQNIHPYY